MRNWGAQMSDRQIQNEIFLVVGWCIPTDIVRSSLRAHCRSKAKCNIVPASIFQYYVKEDDHAME